jgi:hypothetical protein
MQVMLVQYAYAIKVPLIWSFAWIDSFLSNENIETPP